MNAYEKIRAALERAEDFVYGDVYLAENGDALAALAELERAATDPVAWMWNDMLGIPQVYASQKRPTWPDAGSSPAMAVAINVRPLYTAPPPAPVAPGMFTAEEAEDFYFQGFDACYNADEMGDMNWHEFWLRSKAFKLIQERTT